MDGGRRGEYWWLIEKMGQLDPTNKNSHAPTTSPNPKPLGRPGLFPPSLTPAYPSTSRSCHSCPLCSEHHCLWPAPLNSVPTGLRASSWLFQALLPQQPWRSSPTRTKVMSFSCSELPVTPIYLLDNWPCLLAPTHPTPSLPHCTCHATHSQVLPCTRLFPVLKSLYILFPLPKILFHASWPASL